MAVATHDNLRVRTFLLRLGDIALECGGALALAARDVAGRARGIVDALEGDAALDLGVEVALEAGADDRADVAALAGAAGEYDGDGCVCECGFGI